MLKRLVVVLAVLGPLNAFAADDISASLAKCLALSATEQGACIEPLMGQAEQYLNVSYNDLVKSMKAKKVFGQVARNTTIDVMLSNYQTAEEVWANYRDVQCTLEATANVKNQFISVGQSACEIRLALARVPTLQRVVNTFLTNLNNNPLLN